MIRRLLSNPVTHLILVVVGAVVVTLLVISLNPDKVGDWLRTLAATFISALTAVAIGVGLFNLQTGISDQQSIRRLSAVLEAELRDMRSTLTEIRKVQGLAYSTFDLLTLDEAIRSGLFPTDDTIAMIHLKGTVRTHNALVDYLATRSNRTSGPGPTIQHLKLRQNALVAYCDSLLDRLDRFSI